MSGDYRYPACDVSPATFSRKDAEAAAERAAQHAARLAKKAQDDIAAEAAVAPVKKP